MAKIMEVIMGPYRGNRLLMEDADADGAVSAHWAFDPFAPPEDPPRDPLTEQERDDALAASYAWAEAMWAIAQGLPDPRPEAPPEGTLTTRQMGRPSNEGGYTTRGVRSPQPHR